MMMMHQLSPPLLLIVLSACAVFCLDPPPPAGSRTKRQGSTVLTKAWNEALPGVPPFWDKYSSGPYGRVKKIFFS